MSWIENSDASSKFNLDVDQSHYNVSSRYGAPLYLYTLSSVCVKCPFTKLHQIKTQSSFAINSASDYSFRLFEEDQGTYSNATSGFLCELNRPSGEFGAYHMIIHASGLCDVETVYEPVNIHLRKAAYLDHFLLLFNTFERN